MAKTVAHLTVVPRTDTATEPLDAPVREAAEFFAAQHYDASDLPRFLPDAPARALGQVMLAMRRLTGAS